MARKRSSELDKAATFYIPENFIEEGTLFGGLLKLRNTVEALIIFGIILLCILKFGAGIGFQLKAILIVVLACPPAALALFGINDGPLSEFILDYINFKRSPREILYFENSSVQEETNEVDVKDKTKGKKQQKSKKINKNIKERGR